MALLGSIIAWIVFGLLVGLISRALYPGSQKMSLPNTIALGIAGSLVGGAISWLLGYRPQEAVFQGAGWILSIVGGLIVVWAAMALGSRKT
jgi:uncharacterized membrane protein YeaQ/YmgE (transglycosylase-associated protein family)